MKKLSFLLITVAAVVLLLSSCQATIVSFSDTEVSFNSSGYVQKDLTYTNGSTTYTYSTDGTYEYVTNSWDTTSSSWKQSSGYKGTYSYVPSTHMLTINYTQTWSGGIGGSYVALTTAATDAKTMTYPKILGSANQYWVCTGSSGTYTYVDQVTYWNGASYKQTNTYAVASDLSTVTETDENENYNASGTATGGNKVNYVCTADKIFPSSVTSLDNAKGKVVAINYLKYVTTSYTWSSGTTFTTGTVTTNNNPGSYTVSLASDGSYFTWADNSVARHLGTK